MPKARRSLLFMFLFFFVCSSPFLLSACENRAKEEKLNFTTEYQAVFMANGQVFFGKIENAGAAYPLLKEVYYIGRQAAPEEKEVRSILIKRGSEWHKPEYMYINRQHIAVIEPVSPDSRVAQLIKEAKTAKPAEAQQP
ncbi:MAG: hypothetical protein A4E70_01118 [Syntrophus sp. PtaU1.Bin005]|jgi:hypothetical protein|nr:MAG: hypothetical protein A4E69_01675 [Syntrophus sp. PtaB.Bin138]OPY81684.1 MAG: hypothetical protein A4E70_01118 [Syntrophus sp. PtaU1.Bin005]